MTAIYINHFKKGNHHTESIEIVSPLEQCGERIHKFSGWKSCGGGRGQNRYINYDRKQEYEVEFDDYAIRIVTWIQTR